MSMTGSTADFGASPSSQSGAGGQLAKLVGSWQAVTTTVKQGMVFPSLLTFTGDGIVLANEPPGPFDTPGHGVWVSTGPDSANYTFLALVGGEAGVLTATMKIVGAVRYDAGADTWRGPFKIQIVDTNGSETLADDGTFDATRIAVESLDDTPGGAA